MYRLVRTFARNFSARKATFTEKSIQNFTCIEDISNLFKNANLPALLRAMKSSDWVVLQRRLRQLAPTTFTHSDADIKTLNDVNECMSSLSREGTYTCTQRLNVALIAAEMSRLFRHRGLQVCMCMSLCLSI